jgi:hypothetical protein
MSFAPVQAPVLAPVRTSGPNCSRGAGRPCPEAYSPRGTRHGFSFAKRHLIRLNAIFDGAQADKQVDQTGDIRLITARERDPFPREPGHVFSVIRTID